MSKKRSKKFGKKRASSAANDVADTDVESVESNADEDAVVAAADESTVAETILAEGSAAIEAVSEPVLAEGSVANEVDAVAAASDDVAADAEAGSKRSKKDKKTKKSKAAKSKATEAVAADSHGDVEADVEAPALDVVAGELSDEEVAALASEVNEAEAAVHEAVDAVPDATALAAATDDVDPAVVVEGEEADAELPAAAAAMDASQLAQLIEALIFATDKPLTVQRIRQLTRVADVSRIEAALAKIAVDYADRGIVLSSVSGGYQFRTRSQFSSWVQQLIAGRPVRLSRAQLETLAIVAYRQPITRPEIDEIRGVDSGGTLKVLLDRQLIRALGKKEEVGRPVLYGTTKEFLDFFSLGDLRELPTLREYSELTDESRSVMKKMGLDAPDSPLPNPDTDGVAVEGASTDGSDEMAAFEAIANAAELQDELGDIGETGDIGDVLSDEPLDTPDEYAAASGRVDVMEADHDGEDSRELAAGTAGNDDAEPALPSWVVPVDESEPVEIENEMPSMLMRDASEEDASDGAEVTRDGEWVAASEAVEATDDVASDMFDDDVS